MPRRDPAPADPPPEETDESTGEEPAAAPAPGGRGLWLASALAVTFAITTVILAVVASSIAADKDRREEGRQEVEEAASRFIVTFLSYDYREPERQREEVLALSVRPFTEQFESAFPDLQRFFAEVQGTATTTVDAVFVGDVGDDQATAIVIYDRVVESQSGVTPELDFYAQVDLVRLGGEWKVSGVTNINLVLRGDDLQAPGSPTTATTPTTAG